jgi:RimJ/RimL family protein N-acetyltransferase
VTTADVLETDRLRLWPCATADVPALHALWTDPEVRRYLWDGEVVDRDRVRAVVDRSDADFRVRGFGLWLVGLRADEAVGFCGLRSEHDLAEPRPEPGAAELLYGLHPRWWGLGLAGEAAGAVLRHALGTLGVTQVVAAADAPNLRSLRLLERLGMRPAWRGLVDGRDTIGYALSRADGSGHDRASPRPVVHRAGGVGGDGAGR